jgi:hypothetical protein
VLLSEACAEEGFFAEFFCFVDPMGTANSLLQRGV